MPHQHSDVLLPGETLLPGEFLSSVDGRFRLELTTRGIVGRLEARAYTPEGIKEFWFTDAAGANAKLRVTGGAPSTPVYPRPYPHAVLMDGDGNVVWSSEGVPYRGWESLYLSLQPDGNLVFYARNKSSGNVTATWASGTHSMWQSQVAIPPNTYVAEIIGPGALILQPNAGDTDVVNASGELVAARAGTHVVPIPPNQQISMVTSGALDIVTMKYEWEDLSAPHGTRPNKRSADAVGVPPQSSPGRRRIEIGRGASLALHGFENRPELESAGKIVIVGGKAALAETQDDEATKSFGSNSPQG